MRRCPVSDGYTCVRVDADIGIYIHVNPPVDRSIRLKAFSSFLKLGATVTTKNR